jgi:hypothetical protein
MKTLCCPSCNSRWKILPSPTTADEVVLCPVCVAKQ